MLLVNKQNEWWLEVSTFDADAHYSAFLDYSEAKGLKHPVDTVHAQWSTKDSKDTERFIPAGGRGRIFVYGVSEYSGIYKQVFRFIRDGIINEYSGHYAWTDDAPPHNVDKGILKVIVTAMPPLQNGTLMARFSYEGHSLWVIEGEVQSVR